ncbi:MAG: beta-galactosidase [Deltaproteobacteria bacterium]|jgi:hypothetical protein|nr:beta-galactosidase [Deltaproteobacteria bacterium]MBW2537054.1 beta-galactosidase [Deltaproteobacteria bacterium]
MATRSATWLTIGVLCAALAGCTELDSSGGDHRLEESAADAGQGGGGGSFAEGEQPGSPHVAIVDGVLLVDGEPTYLYGGDLHYFRVRDRDYDPAITEQMWAETLDRMVDGGMNFVSTYAPWDYHHLSRDVWSFEGARDVGRFVDMACDRGLYVLYKPGPLITAEWPRGFGNFGAVPAWWKEENPDALARSPDGSPFNYSPLGAADQTQPSLLHPTYLEAARAWYARALEPVRKHLGGCLIGLQIDNETNLYWGGRYDVDYSDVAIAHYRDFLRQRHLTIEALNQHYGASYSSFEAVDPPTSAPGPSSNRADNPWHADWYWAGQSYVQDYLFRLKEMMADEGFTEPDLLLLTNDSPFTLQMTDYAHRNVLVHDGPTKNAVALAGIDLYPKQFPTSGRLFDQPFQTDFFVRLYDQSGDLATGEQEFVFATEFQGGFFDYPLVGPPDVRASATEQTLARGIGRGLKGLAYYVVRDGLNADDSSYDYGAAIDAAGRPTERYEVVERWGRFLQTHGVDLMRSVEVKNRIAVVTHGAYAAPQGGVADNLQRLTTIEQPAVFGWLAAAGYNPEVLDIRLTDPAELAELRAVFYLNPDFIDDEAANKLNDYARGGGMIVNFLWPGRTGADGQPTAATRAYAELFAADEKGLWSWVNTGREGLVNATFGGTSSTLSSYWYQSQWSPLGSYLPLLWERTEPLKTNGDVVGWASFGTGTQIFLGTYVATPFNESDYYGMSDAEVERATSLADYLMVLAGEEPILSTGRPRELVWARRSPERLYLFVVNDGAADAFVTVRADNLAALGLTSDVAYEAHDLLAGEGVGSLTGEELARTGLPVFVPAESATVVGLR